MTTKIQEIAFHRNGVTGDPFHAVLFLTGRGKGTQRFVATVFRDAGCIAILCLDSIETDGVTFGKNSWCAESFEPEIRAEIHEWERREYRRVFPGMPESAIDEMLKEGGTHPGEQDKRHGT